MGGGCWGIRGLSPECPGLSPTALLVPLLSGFRFFDPFLLCRSGCGNLMPRGRWQEHGRDAAHAGLVRAEACERRPGNGRRVVGGVADGQHSTVRREGGRRGL